MNAQLLLTTQTTRSPSPVPRRRGFSLIVFALTLLTSIPYAAATQPDHIIMVVLEGVGKEAVPIWFHAGVSKPCERGSRLLVCRIAQSPFNCPGDGFFVDWASH